MNEITKQELEVFDFLDELRESGVTNMFGAQPYVDQKFPHLRKQSSDIVIKWMTTFEERHPND